jgi:hypothetical protein
MVWTHTAPGTSAMWRTPDESYGQGKDRVRPLGDVAAPLKLGSRGPLDLTSTFAKDFPMSRWLPVHVRRIIAILLLLLDLVLEPGSALSFVGIDDSEDKAVADLCRTDDFSWGRSIPCPTIGGVIGAAPNAPCANDGLVPAKQSASAESARVHVAIGVASVEAVVGAIRDPFEIVPFGLGLLPSDAHSLHCNSYIAQKRDIVLIV